MIIYHYDTEHLETVDSFDTYSTMLEFYCQAIQKHDYSKAQVLHLWLSGWEQLASDLGWLTSNENYGTMSPTKFTVH